MRTAILCLPLLVAGCAGSSNTPAKPAPAAAAKPAAAPAPATPAGQPTPARPASSEGDAATADETAPGRGDRREAPELRPYDRVITKDAKSDQGVFTVHRIRDRVYYEIPKDMLGREFLWVTQIAKTTLGAGYGGQAAGNRVVRWERRGDGAAAQRVLRRSSPIGARRSRRRSTTPTSTRSSWRSTSRRSARTARPSSR